MENKKKHIAAIFEEQKVFITYSGSCYQYVKEQGTFRCHKMDNLKQKVFWNNYRQQTIAKQENLISWHPVAENVQNQPINQNFERQFICEILKRPESEMLFRFQEGKRQMNLDK